MVIEWLVTNWFWLLIDIAFVALHLFGHGGYDGHNGDGRRQHTGGYAGLVFVPIYNFLNRRWGMVCARKLG